MIIKYYVLMSYLIWCIVAIQDRPATCGDPNALDGSLSAEASTWTPTSPPARTGESTTKRPGGSRSLIFIILQLWPSDGYGSIVPIKTIFRGMNIHLPATLMWTKGVQGFDTLPDINGIITPITQVMYHHNPSYNML